MQIQISGFFRSGSTLFAKTGMSCLAREGLKVLSQDFLYQKLLCPHILSESLIEIGHSEEITKRTLCRKHEGRFPDLIRTALLKQFLETIVSCFMSLSTLFKSFRDDGRVIMEGSVQWSTVQRWAEFYPSRIKTKNLLIWSQEPTDNSATVEAILRDWFQNKCLNNIFIFTRNPGFLQRF